MKGFSGKKPSGKGIGGGKQKSDGANVIGGTADSAYSKSSNNRGGGGNKRPYRGIMKSGY